MDIAEGTVNNALALAISELDRRLKDIEEQQEAVGFDQTALAVPRNEEALLNETAACCRKWRRRLSRHFRSADIRGYSLER